MVRDQPAAVGYGFIAGEDTRIARRWFFGSFTDYPAVRETIDQVETRPMFELEPKSDSGNSYTSGYRQHIMVVGDGVSTTVFSHELKHPFLIDQQYDYYPTGRIAHNYVRIENDPVNMMQAAPPSTPELAYVAAAQRIGSIRDSYHRKVEHIGGTPRIQLIEDLLQWGTQVVTEIPLFPPKPDRSSITPTGWTTHTFTDPPRFFLRTTDSGYKHFIVASNPAIMTTDNLALETKELTGHRTIIWDGTESGNWLRETDITAPEDGTRIVSRDAVEVEDIIDLGNAALNSESTELDGRFVADDGEWEIIHIPGRAAIRISSTEIILEHYKSDADKIGDRADVLAKIQMSKDGSITIQNGATNSIELDGTDAIIKGGGRTVTMSGNVVNVT